MLPDWPRNANFNPDNGNANVNNDNPQNSNPKLGVRRLLRVYWLCAAFSHPPSILPISENKACIWKIWVSLASLSSRTRRSFRLIYDYLVPIFDKTFIYDAWSCRKKKGLLGAIERAQEFMRKNPHGFVWKTDIRKFFDSVDHGILLGAVFRKVRCPVACQLIREVVDSFPQRERERAFIGMPIGNLTSQIFANIYLNELDRFAVHHLRPKHYLRYGDDFILVDTDLERIVSFREDVVRFLTVSLKLALNHKSEKILKTRQGLRFLGMMIYPAARQLKKRNRNRIKKRLSLKNDGSYYGLAKKHGSRKYYRCFPYWINELIDREF